MTEFKPIACGFHAHADTSLDGGSTVDTKIKRAKALGRPADCLTDHGVMSGLAGHYASCQKHGIKSIHGIEAYMADMFDPFKIDVKGDKKYNYVHLTIHFKTLKAFRYFCELTPKMEDRAVVKWGERKPIMLWEELEDIANEIVIGSGCLVGAVQKYVLNKQLDKAGEAYDRVRNLVPKGQFFVEVFPHIIDKTWARPLVNKETKLVERPGYFKAHECGADGLPEDIQKVPDQFVIECARRYGDPIVISEDSHIATREDKLVQDVRLGNGQENWKFYNSYHMGETKEWADNLKHALGVSDRDIEEWVDNSYMFVDQFKDYKFQIIDPKKPDSNEWHLPNLKDVYEVQEGLTSKTKLKELIVKHGRMPGRDDPLFEVYRERLAREVKVLTENGVFDFLPYFFVFEDVCSWCREKGLLFNARGSAGGSLVLYLLGCSITDPIKYDLSFERFLTMGRIKSGSLPDIDMDFSSQDLVFEYLRAKYGDRFARISIQKPLKVKGSMKDIERDRFGAVRETTNMLTKLMPKTIPMGVSDFQWLMGYEDETTGAHEKGYLELDNDPGAQLLRQYRDDNPEIWATVLKCLGVMREKSVHACGVIIADKPVASFMPLLHVSDQLCTAYGPKDVEKVGGVKFDFLNVANLKCLEVSLKSLKDTTGQHLEWKEFPHDDRVYTQIIQRKSAALFQIDTPSMRPYTSKIKPSNVDQVSNELALVRPGTLDAASPDPADNPKRDKDGKVIIEITAADFFVNCAKGLRKPYFIHPSLEPILGVSYGVNLFQEQTLRIFRDIGGMDYEQAEMARRAIGKKDKAALMKELAKLADMIRARDPSWTDTQITALCDMIEASSRYSFNKSHSQSYALQTYNGAWLKYFHPLHFWKGELTVKSDKPDDIREYMKECGDLVLPADVLKSHFSEWLIEGDKLRAPLSTLKGVGAVSESVSALILNPLSSFEPKPVKPKPVKVPKAKKGKAMLGEGSDALA